MRRTLIVIAAAAVAAIAAVTPATAAPKQESMPVDLRFVIVGETITDTFITGNDRWFHTSGVAIDVVASGDFGGDEVFGTGSGIGKSHTSVPSDPALGPGYGDDGWAHVAAEASLVSIGTGTETSCAGWFHLRRSPTDDPFPFAYEDGSTMWACSDGRRVVAEVDGFFELDPVTGSPIFVLHVTGALR
jgi:hypothetical protein